MAGKATFAAQPAKSSRPIFYAYYELFAQFVVENIASETEKGKRTG